MPGRLYNFEAQRPPGFPRVYLPSVEGVTLPLGARC